MCFRVQGFDCIHAGADLRVCPVRIQAFRGGHIDPPLRGNIAYEGAASGGLLFLARRKVTKRRDYSGMFQALWSVWSSSCDLCDRGFSKNSS